MEQLSSEMLDNVKHVLFGNQKQANIINDNVARIVGNMLIGKVGSSACISLDAVHESIMKVLGWYIEAPWSHGENDIGLIAGYDSVLAVEQSANTPAALTIYTDTISDTSPKRLYRIAPLDTDPLHTEREIASAPNLIITEKPKVAAEDCTVPTDDFYTRACKIKDAILPLIPDAVKVEIPDNEWAQALCCAEYYYKW